MIILGIIVCVTLYPLIINVLRIYLPINEIDATRVSSLTNWLWFIWIYVLIKAIFKDGGWTTEGQILGMCIRFIIFIITLFTFYPLVITLIGDVLLNNTVPFDLVKPLRGWMWVIFILGDLSSMISAFSD